MSQDGARMAPDGAKMAQDEAKMVQDGTRVAQDVGQTSPEERRKQNKKKSIHPNFRSSSFAGSILCNIHYTIFNKKCMINNMQYIIYNV